VTNILNPARFPRVLRESIPEQCWVLGSAANSRPDYPHHYLPPGAFLHVHGQNHPFGVVCTCAFRCAIAFCMHSLLLPGSRPLNPVLHALPLLKHFAQVIRLHPRRLPFSVTEVRHSISFNATTTSAATVPSPFQTHTAFSARLLVILLLFDLDTSWLPVSALLACPSTFPTTCNFPGAWSNLLRLHLSALERASPSSTGQSSGFLAFLAALKACQA